MKQLDLIKKLDSAGDLAEEELLRLLSSFDAEDLEEIGKRANTVRQKYYGNQVYTRGLIEFTNYCRNDCYYCGIRKSNQNAVRYRLSKEEILSCCKEGYSLGFRTFVLQGGEDGFYTDDLICDIIKGIKQSYPFCAVTLSVGEREKETYQKWFDAGADRYLLRHETANEAHYKKLHPESLSLSHRKQCLFWLKEIGYQVGSGFMVGSPFQTVENLVEDLRFLQKLQPDMIGIGPFIPHKDTDFAKEEQGSLEMTLLLISVLRLLFPQVLLPATTALGTIKENGRELGILAGANVVMPNLSPVSVRKKYALYDNKICTGEESAQCRGCLSNRMESIGFELVTARGDRYGL